MSHARSHEFSEKLRATLKGRIVDVTDVFEIHKTGYNKRIYRMVEEVLAYVAEMMKTTILRLRIDMKAFERLKSRMELR